jgi:hypothetical protein
MIVLIEKKKSFIDKSEKLTISARYAFVEHFSDGLSCVSIELGELTKTKRDHNHSTYRTGDSAAARANIHNRTRS